MAVKDLTQRDSLYRYSGQYDAAATVPQTPYNANLTNRLDTPSYIVQLMAAAATITTRYERGRHEGVVKIC